MTSFLATAGEVLAIDSELPRVADLVAEGAPGQLRNRPPSTVSVEIVVEADRRPFPMAGWRPLTRGAWRRHGEVVVQNACTAGFDMHVACGPDSAAFTYRWRPPRRDLAASLALRSRWHLLARAALIQYPALWWAGTRGRVPLHASVCTAGASTPLLTAASGVGRSTLLLHQLARGERTTGDNLAVGDGTTVWGMVEPVRIEGGGGRRMPHGRNEMPMVERVDALNPDRLVVLERGTTEAPALVPSDPHTAARSLITSTYMAGELRRYWAFAAVLSAGTGVGPPHPPLTDVAAAFASKLRCSALVLGTGGELDLSDLLETATKEVEV